MTQKEYNKCTELMYDAILHAERSIKYYAEARDDKTLTDTSKHVKELQGQDALGYAIGINQALVVIGFKHENMKELGKLIQPRLMMAPGKGRNLHREVTGSQKIKLWR